MRLIARLNVGGPAIHTTLLTERLDPTRYESKLVTGVETEREGNMLELMGDRGVQPVIIPSLGRELSPANDLKTLTQVTRLMRRFRPQIVHTHTAKAGFVGRMAAWLTRVPIIVHTFHGNVFKGYFSPTKTRLFIAIGPGLTLPDDSLLIGCRIPYSRAYYDLPEKDLYGLNLARSFDDGKTWQPEFIIQRDHEGNPFNNHYCAMNGKFMKLGENEYLYIFGFFGHDYEPKLQRILAVRLRVE